jgi:hypothetical protein
MPCQSLRTSSLWRATGGNELAQLLALRTQSGDLNATPVVRVTPQLRILSTYDGQDIAAALDTAAHALDRSYEYT